MICFIIYKRKCISFNTCDHRHFVYIKKGEMNMGVLWGFVIYFVTHTFVNMFILNVYSYSLEKKQEKPIQNALNRFLGKAVIAFIIFIPIFVVFLAVEYFYDFRPAILIGSGIGMITASIHFKLIIKDYYQKSRAQANWDSWNDMTFEEKYERIKSARTNDIQEDTSLTPPASKEENTGTDQYDTQKTSSIGTELNEKTLREIESILSGESPSDYETAIVQYIKGKGHICSIETNPFGIRFVKFHYTNKYLWDIFIRIDREKQMMSFICPFFDVSYEKQGDLVDLLSDYNRRYSYAKFYYEKIDKYSSQPELVTAKYDFPLVGVENAGQVALEIVKIFALTIDTLFGQIPKEVILNRR